MNPKQLVAEFFGTFALIFVGVGAAAVSQFDGVSSGLVGIALAHGLTIACMASATGAISGGHLNPAVTFGLLLAGKTQLQTAIGYWIAQLAGAAAGAFLLKLCLPDPALAVIGYGTPGVSTGEGISPMMAMWAEFFTTFLLVFVVYGTAVDSRAPKMGALFIGLTVTLDIFIAGPISGAAMNPARHFGPALAGGGFANVWIWWVGPMLGGAAAALLWRHLLEERGK